MIIHPHEIPQDILYAARKIQNYMDKNRYDEWELIGICSRNFAYKYRKIVDIVENKEKHNDDE